jgi:hypothetical protein
MQFDDFAPQAGWQQRMVRRFDQLLRWGERRAGRPEAVNGPLFGAFCHTVCTFTEALWTTDERAAWAAQNRVIADRVVQAVRRDPGRRVLVAVQCQRLHPLGLLLRARGDLLQIVRYQEL